VVTERTVVIVNDDEVQGEILRAAISHLPAAVRLYTDVTTALDALATVPVPDLIVTDLYMPGIDGWRFTRLLRSREYARYNDVPIIVTSATFAGEDAARISRETSASGFLSLPTTPATIRETARTVIQGNHVKTETKVLLVDDDSTTLIMLEHAFAEAGYVVHTARTAAEAGATLEAGGFDGAVLDYHLPDAPGDAILDRFARRSDAVYLMLTGDHDPGLALKWIQAGASAYLHKPVEPAFVVEMYRRARRERVLLRIEERLEERTQEVQRLLEEERLLKREIHHRVKNNLAAISALIGIREAGVEDPVARGVLVQTRNDVETVANIYESLFESAHDQSGGNQLVDAAHHFRNLVAQTSSGYPAIAVKIEDGPEPVTIDPTTAMRLGIILNELVTNALKYAFPDGRTGTIAVSFRREGERYSLCVADDGIGLPRDEHGEIAESGGFGLQMVALMARQMNAEIGISTDNGTEIVIRGISAGENV
jgi:two-component sensor histidine kinase